MPYGVKITLAVALTLGGAILSGVAATLGYLLGGSFIFAGGAFISLCACGAAATWWTRLVAERVEADTKALLEARASQVPAKPRVTLPGDVDELQRKLAEVISVIGHGAADAIELSRDIGRAMGDLGSHLAAVEADKSRFAAEAEKVREIVSVATRAAAPRRMVADEPQKPGPEFYGLKRVPQCDEGSVVVPAFLKGPPQPRVFEQPAKPGRLKVDLAEIEEAIMTAAPVG